MPLPTTTKKTCQGRWAGKRTNVTTDSKEGCSSKDNLIFNLTGKELQPHEVSLLNKGLSFVPTRTADNFVTKIELFKFFDL